MIPIPNATKQWKQTNSGEVFGNLFATKNINFDQEGYLKLAKRSSALVNGFSNFSGVTSISALTGTEYYIMTGGDSGHPFKMTLASINNPTDINGTGTGSLNFDGVIWKSRWYVSQSTALNYYDGSSWGSAFGTLVYNNVPHPLCVFENKNQLAVGDKTEVRLFTSGSPDTADTDNILTIPANYQVQWMRYNANKLYIGTKNLTGGEAMLFVWNGLGTSAEAAYPINSNFIFSGCNYNNSIVIFTSKGQLLRFNGGGFDVLASLPVYYSKYSWWGGNPTNGKIVNRGMIADGDIIYINLNGDLSDTSIVLPNQPSGLWVYDPKVGLYHKAGYSNVTVNNRTIDNTTGINTSTSVITISSYTAQTGTKVFYDASSAATGLVDQSFYFLIRVSSTELKLATSYDNAVAGTNIDITSQGTSQVLYFHDDNDFGSSVQNGLPGAVYLVTDYDSNESAYRQMIGSQVLFATQAVANDTISANNYTLQTLTEGENRGYFVTQKIFSNNLKEAWQKIYVKYNYLFEGNDKVIVKYRVSNKKLYPYYSYSKYATWIDTTSFVTTLDMSNVSVGDEIEFVSGSASGWLAHIIAIQESDSGWIISVDETMPVSNADKSIFIVDNWKKIGISESTPDDILSASCLDSRHSKWIQFKIELRGVSEPTIEELQIINKNSQPSV